ncbi:MAG TPA: hypothetical protein PLP14_02445 [Chitinophagaceae bacterium]|nr:hypothetical protein [Chitinophagaceae bacterium]
MSNPKLEFLLHHYIPLLKQIDKDTAPRFGKMNVQQMIEHMADSVAMASEKLKLERVADDSTTEKMRQFILSEKPFRENTPNPHMAADPVPCRHATIDESIQELDTELHEFVRYYEERPGMIVRNPFFGELNFEEWTHLLHKHAWHHLKQFRVSTES